MAGLSPRRRGNRARGRVAWSPIGSIPAQAGEPAWFLSDSLQTRVYPRAGGGTEPEPEDDLAAEGLSPRRRGNLQYVVPPHEGLGSIPAQAGEPPRRRGNPRPSNHQINRFGSIPAQAGEPANWYCRSSASRVYPRAGGGTELLMGREFAHLGLSPRRRGNRGRAPLPSRQGGSIPAQAGEPPPETKSPTVAGVYPRAGGGTTSTTR